MDVLVYQLDGIRVNSHIETGLPEAVSCTYVYKVFLFTFSQSITIAYPGVSFCSLSDNMFTLLCVVSNPLVQTELASQTVVFECFCGMVHFALTL